MQKEKASKFPLGFHSTVTIFFPPFVASNGHQQHVFIIVHEDELQHTLKVFDECSTTDFCGQIRNFQQLLISVIVFSELQ